MNTQLITLVFVAFLQVLTLLLLLRERTGRSIGTIMTGRQGEHVLHRVFEIQGKLTSVQWNVDMVLNGKEGDFGKPNLAQKEFLHQVSEDCRMTSTELGDVLKHLGAAPTSANLHKE